MEIFTILRRPSELAAARAPFAGPIPARAHVVGQPAVSVLPIQGRSGSVVGGYALATPVLGADVNSDNYMREQKQATWLRATKARGIPPRGWPV